MKRNYFIIAFRNLRANLVFSLLNVVGLSIGIACCLVIGLFVVDQYSYDRHNEHARRIYRVVNKQTSQGETRHVALTPGPLAPELIRNFPSVEAATRVDVTYASLSIDDHEPEDERVMAVDPSFLSMFTLDIVHGSKSNDLPLESILLSSSAATRLFGKEDVVGETISLAGLADLKVTGVFRDIPEQSHLRADFLISFEWIEKSDRFATQWNANSYYNYVLMRDGINVDNFNEKMNAMIHQHTPASWKAFEYSLQPLLEVHMTPGYAGNLTGSVAQVLVRGFSLVGLIILMLACFNYMNMATARSAKRAIEVGIRKVVGASRAQLVGQFMTESLFLCTSAFLLAIFWADLFIPVFNASTRMKLDLALFFSRSEFVIALTFSLLIITTISGSYPAFFLSRFVPSAILKGQRSSDTSRRLRKGLVVLQFTLTSVLVILVVVVFKQTNFLKSRDLGFKTDHLLTIETEYRKGVTSESLMSEISKLNGVTTVAGASSLPVGNLNTTSIFSTEKPKDDGLQAQWLFTDHAYIDALGLSVLSGRNFSDNGSDLNAGVIINEKAASAMGWTVEDAIGKRISGFIFSDSLPGEIIGVVKDFHITTLRQPISPLVMGYGTDFDHLLIRIASGNPSETRAAIDNAAAPLVKENQYSSMFLEDHIENTYQSERKIGEFLSFFTFLAILIGGTGLYALSAYEGERRIKELGIRKIMGATAGELMMILSKSFLQLILFALLAAVPLSYFLADYWLQTFPCRISLSIEVYAVTSAALLLLAWLTISGQALKAARISPAEALKQE